MSPSRSASAIVADKTEGYHFLTIHDYSRTKGVPTGEGIGSQPFTEVADYVSFSLELEEDGATAVNAQFRFCFAGEEEEAKQAALLALASVDEFTSRDRWVCTKFINRKVLENSKHLKNNSFMVRCDIVVIHSYRSADNAVTYVSVPPCDWSQDFGKLLETEKGADVVFELFGPMKEGNAAASGVMRLEDMEMDVFKALLRYAYASSLSLQGMANDHVTCRKILVAADRYGTGLLKLICEEWICECINVDTVVTILALAEQHHCEGPKKACFDFLADPAKLRAVMVTSGFQHLWESCPSLMMELMDMCLPH
ncbi:BTB/POZ and MATH domain-containing protein 1-like [Aegilops tauschii subsp. strangulata]|uniref:Protein roadkill n=1 Tax=Aegilops tauschii TaxID=37682 RepID=N1R1J7_AEGTA